MRGSIRTLRPTVSVWFHQPVGVVDESSGSVGVESRFANIAGLPLRRLQRYNGSEVSWENSIYPIGTPNSMWIPHRVIDLSRAIEAADCLRRLREPRRFDAGARSAGRGSLPLC